MPGVGRDPGAPPGRGAPGRGAPGRGPPAPAAGRGPPAPAAGRGPPGPAAAGRCCASSRRPSRGMPCDGANGLLPGRGGRSEVRSAPRSESPRREPIPCDGAKGLLPGRGAPPGRAPEGRVVPADGAAGGVAGRGAGRAAPSCVPCCAGAEALGVAGAGFSTGAEPLENGDACGAAGAAGATGVAGAAGAGVEAAAGAAGAGASGAGASGAAWATPGFGPDGAGAEGRDGAGSAAGLVAPAPGNAPRSFFTTGASMVDEAERTNSPSSCSFATASFEVIPSSFASSCTRTLATFLLSRSAPSQARTVYFLLLIPVARAAGRSNAERNGLVIVAHSSLGSHRVSMRVLTRFPGGRW
ncbi:MAG: bacterial translation initiation factor 2 domain protein [Micrococcaceae bacterium]|nr:bacterial translation initiation factor 2 domain protein [Micrococcaceae bacterium]